MLPGAWRSCCGLHLDVDNPQLHSSLVLCDSCEKSAAPLCQERDWCLRQPQDGHGHTEGRGSTRLLISLLYVFKEREKERDLGLGLAVGTRAPAPVGEGHKYTHTPGWLWEPTWNSHVAPASQNGALPPAPSWWAAASSKMLTQFRSSNQVNGNTWRPRQAFMQFACVQHGAL